MAACERIQLFVQLFTEDCSEIFLVLFHSLAELVWMVFFFSPQEMHSQNVSV